MSKQTSLIVVHKYTVSGYEKKSKKKKIYHSPAVI